MGVDVGSGDGVGEVVGAGVGLGEGLEVGKEDGIISGLTICLGLTNNAAITKEAIRAIIPIDIIIDIRLFI